MPKHTLTWINHAQTIDWHELSNLYKIAPLGDKPPSMLETIFSNSMFMYFVYDEQKLVGVGRALADGADCSYICDVAIHPDYQDNGIGKEIMNRLMQDSKEHTKIILYAVPSKIPFYTKLGFAKMKTAMARFTDQDKAKRIGLVE